ncbi:MAG: MarR family winged helix-turn-helix transcriptional regulator [Gemmatales bacterium]|nr:MarR family winged helix-turn-helix transcriptional regulator [Gemmatales bacterium]MDW7995837.1 MarR family winged helix-turn-helix transcriptional regulator [Gemmatales bacterium]
MTSEPSELEAKIVAALERLAQALQRALWEASWRRGLSATQAQILVYLLHRGNERVNIKDLASRFGLGAATLSASASSLQRKGLVRRYRDAQDRRVVYVRLTRRGRRRAAQLALWTQAIEAEIAELDTRSKERLLATLLEVIARLQRAGLISVARMCTTCVYFRRNVHANPAAPHHCALMDKPLQLMELRVECPDHQPAPVPSGGNCSK